MAILSKQEKKKLLTELKVDPSDLKRYVDPEKQKARLTEVKYTLYETTGFGKVSNSVCEGMSTTLSRKYPKFFESLNTNLKQSDIKILSKTYISMMLFSTLLSLIISLGAFSSIFVLIGLDVLSIVLRTIIFSIVAGAATFTTFYLYPASVSGRRRREIKDDLPFAIIHMAAVAGSGAQPIAMFDLNLI